MSFLLAVSCLIFTIFTTGGFVAVDAWHYGEEEHWSELCKVGQHQSPIDLYKDIAEEAKFSSFIFEKYHQDYPVMMKNNGHSAEIRLHVENKPSVKGGGLPEVYILDHIHFHWPSEHTLNNYRFPLEMHLVHYARNHKDLNTALNYVNGVAVFAVLFDLSPDDDIEFEPLISVIDKLHDKVNVIEQMTLNLLYYLPRDTAGFYRYNGSLTTPGCTEGVIWTIFTNTLRISKSQVKSFSVVETEDKHKLTENFRSLQKLNDRKVYVKISPIRDNAIKNNLSMVLILSTFTLIIFTPI